MDVKYGGGPEEIRLALDTLSAEAAELDRLKISMADFVSRQQLADAEAAFRAKCAGMIRLIEGHI